MTDPPHSAGLPRRSAAPGLLVLVVILAGGCKSVPTLVGAGEPGTTRTQAQPLPLGSWIRGSLDCTRSQCERWYRLEVADAGELEVDVYAPVGPDLPDGDLELESSAGSRLPARVTRVQTRRQLRHPVQPGSYLLRIRATGPKTESFDYEVVAGVNSEKRQRQPVAPKEPPPAPIAAPEPTPAPEPAAEEPAPPEPEPVYVTAEVLDIEDGDVMLDKGTPDGVVRGMTGELVKAEVVLGEVEILEVFEAGSRARVLGTPMDEIDFDTLVRIELPPRDDDSAAPPAP